MKIIIHGSREQIQELVQRLPAVLAVEHVSKPYPNHYGDSEFRVYVTCNLDYFTCPGCGRNSDSQADYCGFCGLAKSWSDKNVRGLSGIDLENLLK